MSSEISVLKESGSGRAWLLLIDDSRYQQFAQRLYDQLTAGCRALLILLPRIDSRNWREVSDELRETAARKGLRQISLIAFGDAAASAQDLALRQAKLVRSLVLVDAHTRPHPSRCSRLLAAIERSLPLGLPFRRRDGGFDGKPFLQRLRCPVLIATTGSDAYAQGEARALHEGAPISWRLECGSPQELAAALRSFQEIPVKRPQKNLRPPGGADALPL